MNERIRPQAERRGGAGGPSLFDNNESSQGLVTVSNGPYLEQLPVGDMTVGEIRRRFSDRFDIDPTSQAVLNGQQVDDQTTVRAGQALMFTRRAGEKGAVA